MFRDQDSRENRTYYFPRELILSAYYFTSHEYVNKPSWFSGDGVARTTLAKKLVKHVLAWGRGGG